MQWIKFVFGKSNLKRPLYEYPNDRAKTMAEALADIWDIYQQDKIAEFEIDIQGMGCTVGTYVSVTVILHKGKIKWKDTPDVDGLSFASRARFVEKFVPWATTRCKVFSDSNEFCLAVYRQRR
jgi:hypothetical protein